MKELNTTASAYNPDHCIGPCLSSAVNVPKFCSSAISPKYEKTVSSAVRALCAPSMWILSPSVERCQCLRGCGHCGMVKEAVAHVWRFEGPRQTRHRHRDVISRYCSCVPPGRFRRDCYGRPFRPNEICSCCSWCSPPVPVVPASLAAPGALDLIAFPWSRLQLIFAVLDFSCSCMLLIFFARPIVSAFAYIYIYIYI